MPFIDDLSKRAPSIVVFTLFATLLIDWMGAPPWFAKVLAAAVGCLAILLFLARGNRHGARRAQDQIGLEERKSWIEYELAGKGSPRGYYILGFFCLLVAFLTGFNTDYAIPAWAAAALAIAWGIANASYPVDEEIDA